jgi:hypothetical protein
MNESGSQKQNKAYWLKIDHVFGMTHPLKLLPASMPHI